MLGYVRIDKGELKVREYEIYTGYYCGVCKSIGSRYGQLPRMVLSYDAAFLAVLLASIADEPDKPEAEHCIGHHIKHKTVIRNEAVDFAADVMLILAWHKLQDDVNDEGKLSARAAMTAFKRLYRKLYKQYPVLCDNISAYLKSLTSMENSNCGNLDMAADAFAKIMETIFCEGICHLYGNEQDISTDFSSYQSAGCDDPAGSRETDPSFLSIDTFDARHLTAHEAFSAVGYHLGKWVYLIDAADDIEENIESGAYNPLICRYEFDGSSETAAEFRERIKDSLSFSLYNCLAVLDSCINQLHIKKNRGIIENIVYFGLNRKTEEILKGDFNESV